MPIPVKASSHAPYCDAAANIKPSTAAKAVDPVPIAPLFSGSNIAVFLRNLRLLNFDQHSDWPSICPESFSTKGAQQNQKHRIRCVEWGLYRLFEIWDLEATHEVGSLWRATDHMIRVDNSGAFPEASAPLPTPPALTVDQSSCRTLSQSLRTKEKWGLGTRGDPKEDNAGRLRRRSL